MAHLSPDCCPTEKGSSCEEKDSEEIAPSLTAFWSLTAAAWGTRARIQHERKGVGVSEQGISPLLALSLQSNRFWLFPTLPSTPHL